MFFVFFINNLTDDVDFFFSPQFNIIGYLRWRDGWTNHDLMNYSRTGKHGIQESIDDV